MLCDAAKTLSDHGSVITHACNRPRNFNYEERSDCRVYGEIQRARRDLGGPKGISRETRKDSEDLSYFVWHCDRFAGFPGT